MKTAFAIFFASAISVLATGWDDRVNYYCNKVVESRFYAISENEGIYTVSKWDADKTGKPEPTIAQLTADDAAVDAWDESSEAKKRQRKDMADLRIEAESNLLVFADSMGMPDRPVKWKKLQNKAMQWVTSQGTNNASLYTLIQVNFQYNVYRDNGGDPWKIGKDVP